MGKTTTLISRILTLLTVSIVIIFVETIANAKNIRFTTQTNIVGIRGNESSGTLWQSAELVLATDNKRWSFGNDHDWNLEKSSWSNESTIRLQIAPNISSKAVYLSGSNTDGYMGGGICLSNNFEKTFGFIETTLYIPREGIEEEYLDFFGGISHRLDDMFSIGAEGYWDIWTSTGDKLMQIGPVVSVQMDNIRFSTRISKNWYDPTIGTPKQSGEIRVEISIAM
jgi:hypothetical protein